MEQTPTQTLQQSDSIKEIACALCKFQAGMEAITKDATNPFFGSKYASLANIIEDTRAPLAAQGLSYAQFPTDDCGLTTILMHTSGEWLKATYYMNPADQKPQSIGSAITYMRRYALSGILGLQVEDDDGNAASTPAQRATKPAMTHMPRKTYDENEEEVPAVAPGDPTPADPKKQIVAYLKTLAPKAKTKAEMEKAVKAYTSLDLVPENFDEIITRLGVVVAEHKDIA